MVNALVTGGSGFIGRHLVSALVTRGDRVRVLDIADPQDLPSQVEFVRGSVLDQRLLSAAMADVSHVYHLAAIAHLWAPRREVFARVNEAGTEVVLRAAHQQRIERLVHCSTEAILLPRRATRDFVDETVLPPESDMPGPYTRSKHRAESAVIQAAREGLNVVVVNPTVPLGPGDRGITPPTAMLSHFLNSRSPFFLDCILNLVDVREVAAGMIRAAQFGRSGERYILGGENIPMRRLLELIETASLRSMPKRAVSGSLALGMAALAEWTADHVTGRRPAATREGVHLALRSLPFDCRKAQQELGYAVRPIGEALTEAMQWLSTGSSSSRGRAPGSTGPHRSSHVG
jgi:dihydroflavonol-4-reductase